MNTSLATRTAALLGLLAVVLGASGAHGPVHEVLARNQTEAIWEKAVFYHFIHAVMLYLLATRKPPAAGPWLSFFAGILFFSGSLYLLAFTNVKWLGAITPFGGLSFMVGWAWLMMSKERSG